MKNLSYSHLTEADRIRVEVWLQEGRNQSYIARKLDRARSTISREIKNRGAPKTYVGRFAQINYRKKREMCRPKRKVEETDIGSYVIAKIRAGWSPEAISGRINMEISKEIRPSADYINHESIYQFVYDSEFGKSNKLYQYLRRGKKRRTRKYGRKTQKEIIPNRVFIDRRPEEANQRTAVGHWESDTIHYPERKGLNSLVERRTRYVELTKMQRRTAEETERAVRSKLRNHIRKTLTMDNGSENRNHESIAKSLSLLAFFCHAYHSWEKGTNENTNGLVRRYLPRRTDLDTISQQDLDDIANELNNRPRAILGFYTPKEMLEYEYQKLITCCT